MAVRKGRRHAPRGARTTAALNDFIQSMGIFYEARGMPRIAGRILTLLLCHPAPLSAAQISARLSVARSSVSTNIHLLQGRGAAEPVTYAGDRLTYYRFSWDTWQRSVQAQLAGCGTVKAITARVLAALPASDPSHGRIREYDRWVDFFIEQYQVILDNWPAWARTSGA
jgi:hypothetical protein